MGEFNRTNENKEIRGQALLRHELQFVKSALLKGRQKLLEANRNYGDTVASSGGDWAFDDPASIQAAKEAHFAEKQLKVFEELEYSAESLYPNPSSNQAGIGSRVTIQFQSENLEIFDVVTRVLPNMPVEDGVSLLSSHSPTGIAIIGARSGDNIFLKLANGRKISAKLLEVDQLSQRKYYENLFSQNLSEDG